MLVPIQLNQNNLCQCVYHLFTFSTDTSEWRVPIQGGSAVLSTFGHSSVYSQVDGLVYVFGGTYHDRNRAVTSNRLYTINPSTFEWWVNINTNIHTHMYVHTHTHYPVIIHFPIKADSVECGYDDSLLHIGMHT